MIAAIVVRARVEQRGDIALLKKPSGLTADRCSYTGTEGGTKTC
jgi:hypothetical protein